MKHPDNLPSAFGWDFLGQVQSRKCIEDVIHFAWEEKLFLLADEVRAAWALRGEGVLSLLGEGTRSVVL